jgi:hypothetical protein
MTVIRTLPLVVTTLALVVASDRHLQAGDIQRIRPMAPYLEDFLREGLAGSSTFRALVERIKRSDLVVYLAPGTLDSRLRGRLRFMGAAGHARYLRIEVGWQGSEARSIASLGHELQHAVEVADAPEIRDEASFGREFARIGYPSSAVQFGEDRYDTRAAVDAGFRVWQELASEADD